MIGGGDRKPFRIGFNPREGLVLHTISYNDKGTERPVMYRAALSEMVVPYGDTAPTHWNKNVFDMGEVGMGMSANPLTLGCDCLGEIFYFDGIHVDYHKPTDTVDKIDFDKMARVDRLVFETGWRIANLDHRLKKDAATATAAAK